MSEGKGFADNSKASPIYQMTVALEYIRPPVWRRFQTASGITLHGLHVILQTVMGWTRSHLFSFEINGTRYEDPALSPDPLGAGVLDVRGIRLDRAVQKENMKFIYTYDFGDDWRHLIQVESILPAQPGMKRPVCLGGQRACPPEDCGGPPGHSELLQTLSDKRHPDYLEMKNWVGPAF